jgi:hypothetical protein
VLVVQKGGIELIMQALKLYPNDVEIQENACGALRSLAVCADNKPLIGEKGAIDLILKAMQLHPNVSAIQENACAALWNLAEFGNSRKDPSPYLLRSFTHSNK